MEEVFLHQVALERMVALVAVERRLITPGGQDLQLLQSPAKQLRYKDLTEALELLQRQIMVLAAGVVLMRLVEMERVP